MPGLRVGLDLLHLDEECGGTGTHARELVPALRAAAPDLELVLHVGRAAPAWVGDAGVEVVRWPVLGGDQDLPGAVRLLLTHWAALARDARRRRLDVLHGLAYAVPPAVPGTATVVTVHDVLWRRHRRTMGWRGTVGLDVVSRVSARTADRVQTSSAAARDEVGRALRLPPGRVDVVPLAVSPHAGPATPGGVVRTRLGLGDRPVVLAVAQKRRHKNLAVLVRALPDVPDAVLVLPGTPTPHEAELRAEAEALGVADRVVTPAWLPEEDLRGLRRLAAVAALPSWDEGFGLPVLEAMAAGVPVVVSDIPVLREVAGDAAVRADPASPSSFAAALRTAMAAPGPLVAAGHRRVAAYSWRATAAATLASYERAVESRRRS